MSFFVDDVSGDLVRNLWPKEFKHLKDDPTGYLQCLDWQAVPNNAVELSEWVQLVRKPPPFELNRPYIVANAMDSDDTDAEIFEVSVRIQGFLERHSLGALGNWDGKEHSAPRANQTIVLGGGGYDAEWIATVRAINRLSTVLAKLAQPEKSYVPPLKEEGREVVSMRRRVFIKANGGLGHIPKEANHRGNELRRVMDHWHLDEPLEFGQLIRDGTARRATQVIFNKGHFVDVTASLEVIVSKDPDAAVVVQLKPSRIVLLGTEGVRKGRPGAETKPVKISKRTRPSLHEAYDDNEDGYIPSVLYGTYNIMESAGEHAGGEAEEGGVGEGEGEQGVPEHEMDTRV